VLKLGNTSWRLVVEWRFSSTVLDLGTRWCFLHCIPWYAAGKPLNFSYFFFSSFTGLTVSFLYTSIFSTLSLISYCVCPFTFLSEKSKIKIYTTIILLVTLVINVESGLSIRGLSWECLRTNWGDVFWLRRDEKIGKELHSGMTWKYCSLLLV
jgi:hypothetical protein